MGSNFDYRRPIAREHVYGAIIWAYGAGRVSVKPWETPDHFSRFRGDSGVE